MTEITIVQIDNQLVVDSRIIAEQLEIEHRSFIKLIKKHQLKIEAKFGQVRFEIATVQNSVGAINEVNFAYLNEGQITALLTLCRNTERVVDLKFDLVEKFQQQKRQLEDPIDRTLYNELARRISDLEMFATYQPRPTLVPDLTKKMRVKELVKNYVRRMGCEYRVVWTLLYEKFGVIYGWYSDPDSTDSIIDQIETAGGIDELYDLALQLFL